MAKAKNTSDGRVGKKKPGRRGHGSRRHRPDEGQLVLMGQGLYKKYELMNNETKRTMQGKKNHDKTEKDA